MLAVFFIVRFVMRFLVPLARLVQMTHRGISEVKQKINQQRNTPRSAPRQVEGEYIDYEEVK